MKHLLVALVLLFWAGTGQSPAADPFAPHKGDKAYIFLFADDATHQGLGHTQVDLGVNGDMGSVVSVSDVTDATGKLVVTMDPTGANALAVHVDGYNDLTVGWDGVSSPVLFSLHAVPQTANGDDAQPVQVQDGYDGGQPAAPDPDLKARLHTLLVGLLFVVLPVAGFLLLQEVAMRTVHLLMMRRGSPKTATAPAEEPGEMPEAMPGFLEMNTLNGLLLSGAAEARLLRAEETSGRKLRILELSLLAQVCGLGAAIALIAWLMPKAFAAAMPEIGIGAAALFAVDALLAFYAWTTWLQGARLVELLGGLSVALTIAFTVLGLRDKMPVLIVLPLVLQVSYLAQGVAELRREARKDGNRKLVILRVFGSDSNTAFTFGKLMERWRFVGSYLTIVDPAYIRHRFSVFARGNVSRSLGVTLTVGTLAAVADQVARFAPMMLPQVIPYAWASLPPDQLLVRVRAVLYTVLAVLAVIPMVVYLWRHFLKSAEQAFAGVERVGRSKLSVETDYHGSPFFCYDDVWQPAVRKMLAVADVVLMDLRGFSERRQGCAYELGELVDHFPVDRLLFLVDKTTPRELLRRLILERWEKMRADSPNRGIVVPIIQLYETADRSARDIHHIASLLSAALEGQVQTQAQLTHWGIRMS